MTLSFLFCISWACRPITVAVRIGELPAGAVFLFSSRLHRLDLVVGEEKLLGSAQRRMKNAVLQHGSLILASILSSKNQQH